MAQNLYDQASRYAAKLDPAGFLAWLLGSPSLSFNGWLDTRTIPFPGGNDRTGDTVASLGAVDNSGPWAIAVEFCLEPDDTMFGRLLEYLGRLWREKRAGETGTDRFQIGAAVVNLTGQGTSSRDMRLTGTGLQTCLQVVERNLAQEDAAAILGAILAGTVPRCILPWIALMHGGDDPAIVERWKELAAAEADSRRRGDYGGLAIVFAEAAGRRFLWHEALKEWNMRESLQVLEWIEQGRTEGEVQGEIKALLRMLSRKFPPGPPSDLIAAIKSCTDLRLIEHWIDAASDAASLDDFRRALGS